MSSLKIIKSLLFLIILTLGACSASTSDEKNEADITKISTLTTEVANCEEKMRVHILKHSLPFTPVKQFEKELVDLGKFIDGTAESQLVVEEKDGQRLEYGHEDSYVRNANKTMRLSRVGLSEKDSANPLYFENKIKVITSDSIQTIAQRYTLNTSDKSCVPELSQTTFSKITKQSKTSYQFKETAISYNGEVITDSLKLFSLKEHQRLSDFVLDSATMSYDDMLKQKDLFGYFPGLGLVEMVIAAEKLYEELAFEKHFSFRMIKVRVLAQDKEIFSMVGGEDAGEKVSITIQQNRKLWALPFDKYFDKVFLGQAPISTSNAVSKLDADYQVKNDSIVLKTKNKIDYESFAAYWNIIKLEAASDGYVYQLKEKYLPTVIGKTQELDLASNSTIQTDLPEVQELALKITKAAPSDRAKQIQMILDYLATNYSYDYDMLNKGVIRPLTTKEALDRRKGVCQHYAVIFTALARALKIPSRIIVGFLIRGESVGMHAWVEAEVSPKLWQVIEPQSQNGLNQTRTRFYFPLSRATNLEDKDSNFPNDFITATLSNKFEFLKAE